MGLTAEARNTAQEVYSRAAFFELWAQMPHRAIEMLRTTLRQGTVAPHLAIATIGQTQLDQPQWQPSEASWADHYRLSFLMHDFLRAEWDTSSKKYVFPYDFSVQQSAIKTMCQIASVSEMPMVAEAIYRAESSYDHNGTTSYPWDSEFILGAIEKITNGATHGEYPKQHDTLDLIARLGSHLPIDDASAWNRYFRHLTDHEDVLYAAPRKHGSSIDVWHGHIYQSVPLLSNYLHVLFDGDLATIESNQTLQSLIKASPVKLAIALVDSTPDLVAKPDAMAVVKNIFTQCAAKFGKIYSYTADKWRDYDMPYPNIFDTPNGQESLAGVFTRAVACGILPDDVLSQLDVMRKTREHLLALEQLRAESIGMAWQQAEGFQTLLDGTGKPAPV